MKTFLAFSIIAYVAGAGAVTFINNSDKDATMYIAPRNIGLYFEVSVDSKKREKKSIKAFVASLPYQNTIPFVFVQVDKKPIQETHCHPSTKPMSYYSAHDNEIEIIYDGIGNCHTKGGL